MMIAGAVGLLLALAGAYVQGRMDGRRIGDAKVAEYRAAYETLADRAKACSAGAYEAEQAAQRAAAEGRRARSDAAGAVEVATKSAEALGRAMAQRGTCADAVQTVRNDLKGKP